MCFCVCKFEAKASKLLAYPFFLKKEEEKVLAQQEGNC